MGEELSSEGYIGQALLFHRSQNINTESYQQKIQISLNWIEENSRYSSKDSTDYTKDITKIEETIKD
jgi:esterase/lipase